MQKCKKLYRGLDMRILTCYNNIIHPGIAKLVSRLVWDQETVRSSRTTRTNEKGTLKSLISEPLFLVQCLLLGWIQIRRNRRG